MMSSTMSSMGRGPRAVRGAEVRRRSLPLQACRYITRRSCQDRGGSMADGGARACDTPVRVHSHCPPARTASRGGAAEGRHDSALFKRPGSVASQTKYTSHCPSTVGRLVGRRFKPEPKLERASTNQKVGFILNGQHPSNRGRQPAACAAATSEGQCMVYVYHGRWWYVVCLVWCHRAFVSMSSEDEDCCMLLSTQTQGSTTQQGELVVEPKIIVPGRSSCALSVVARMLCRVCMNSNSRFVEFLTPNSNCKLPKCKQFAV